jgi:NitT/TauT family transport system substrate-binding protein
MSTFNRRDFGLSVAAAGAAGVLPFGPALAAEPPPETRTIRLRKDFAICFAPYYVVTKFLEAEGFDDVQYVDVFGDEGTDLIAQGGIDIAAEFSGQIVANLDNGKNITALGGIHVGCYELFAREPIRRISDLRGRRIGIKYVGFAEYLYVSLIAAYVGLDPMRDLEWVAGGDTALEMFMAGETDAYLGFPPEPQILRANGHDRVILNTVLDRPWSQYFCCTLFGNRDWVRAHPVATKRFLRALYRAAEFCTLEPEKSAQHLVDSGFVKRYDYALETIRLIPYDLWHDYDAEDTMRFYALKMHEVGMLKTDPNTLIAEGTDWRFLNELKREMKG